MRFEDLPRFTGNEAAERAEEQLRKARKFSVPRKAEAVSSSAAVSGATAEDEEENPWEGLE